MESVFSAVLVSVITSFLVTVMLLRGYSNRLTEMLDSFFRNELQTREKMQKLVLDTIDEIANKKNSLIGGEYERTRKNSPQ